MPARRAVVRTWDKPVYSCLADDSLGRVWQTGTATREEPRQSIVIAAEAQVCEGRWKAETMLT